MVKGGYFWGSGCIGCSAEEFLYIDGGKNESDDLCEAV